MRQIECGYIQTDKRDGRLYVYTWNQERQKRHQYGRLVATIKLGRPLLPTEVVHHVNGDPSDNRFENLAVLASASEHAKIHAEKRSPASQRTSCSMCGIDWHQRTPRCVACNRRHSLWKRQGQPYVPRFDVAPSCVRCGVDHREATPGCRACYFRHYNRNRRRQKVAA